MPVMIWCVTRKIRRGNKSPLQSLRNNVDMPKSRPSAPRPSGGGSARSKSHPAGRTPRPSSGQNPVAKSPNAGKPGGANRPTQPGPKAAAQGKRPSDTHVSSYSVGSPLNRQVGFFQSSGARLVGLALVLAICVLMVLPVARNYFNQRANLSELEQDLAAREEINADLENQLDRWKDDKFVIAQARERLTFVFPGERPYRVMDSEDFVPPEETKTGPQIKPEVKEPWFTTLWSSVEQAGNVGSPDSNTKEDPDAGDKDSQTEPATKAE